jgi:pilus assembly protein Flp/PilA
MQRARDLWRDEEGATAAEYAILAALIAVVIVVAVTAVGTSVNGLFNRVPPGL